MENADTLKILGELVHTAEDGAKGFAEAADRTNDPQLRTVFQECAMGCHSAVIDLQNEIASFGEELAEGGTTGGAMRRAWVNVKSSLGGGDLGLLEDVEREEDKAKATYLKAVKADLPSNIRGIVEAQCEGAIRNHDRIRDLRNRYRAGVA